VIRALILGCTCNAAHGLRAGARIAVPGGRCAEKGGEPAVAATLTLEAAIPTTVGIPPRFGEVATSRDELTLEDIPRQGELYRGIPAREFQVLLAASRGLSVKETAAHLFLGVESVKTYRKRVLARMGCTGVRRGWGKGGMPFAIREARHRGILQGGEKLNLDDLDASPPAQMTLYEELHLRAVVAAETFARTPPRIALTPVTQGRDGRTGRQLHTFAPNHSRPVRGPLTERQCQVIIAAAIGEFIGQTAERLQVTRHTVRKHRDAARTRLGVAKYASFRVIVAEALRQGLICQDDIDFARLSGQYLPPDVFGAAWKIAYEDGEFDIGYLDEPDDA
jgi:DNA-binding NarL/FixJ family response regulator